MASPTREASPGDERAAKRIKVDDSASHANGAQDVSMVDEGVKAAEDAPPALSDITNQQSLTGGANVSDAPANGGNDAAPENKDKQEAPAEEPARRAGIAPVKKEYLIPREESRVPAEDTTIDDDAAEARGQVDEQQERDGKRDNRKGKNDKKDKKSRGQNTERTFGRVEDAIKLCNSRAYYSEFSPRECRFGDRCKLSHDLRKYMEEGRRDDLTTFEGKCPTYYDSGRCSSGWKCRFVRSHMEEKEHEDGRKELILLGVKRSDAEGNEGAEDPEDERQGVYNIVNAKDKLDLNRRRVDMKEVEKYVEWMNKEAKLNQEIHHRRQDQRITDNEDLRAQYTEPPLKPSEKRKLYFGRETPALAPLTTQGNLPFRRICIEMGAQVTYSEMALGMPLLQGTKADWTLMKAHESEISPPAYRPTGPTIVEGYDNSKDLKFGAQISAHQPWVATKATEALRRFCPHLRVIDLNCGCPIDMVFKSGAGSALLDAHNKLERMIRGMNTVSGEIPITAKIRMGIKTKSPNAPATIGKLAFGSRENRERLGAPGCAAITLHGRSREQRYTRQADWSYIAECAALIKTYNKQKDQLTDTAGEPDPSTQANGGKMFFLGNGDCYSHVDYFNHIDNAKVDTVMIGRGALVKPWLFEEIEKGQYLDKSATERLAYFEKFAKYGLDTWGSDEMGIGFTRRFLLEWMSFTHRYVPIGLLETLPPSLNDRPPIYRGRNELETLLASNNYKDWIKITEMFLGPCHPSFTFQPKHKSNAYEAEG